MNIQFWVMTTYIICSYVCLYVCFYLCIYNICNYSIFILYYTCLYTYMYTHDQPKIGPCWKVPPYKPSRALDQQRYKLPGCMSDTWRCVATARSILGRSLNILDLGNLKENPPGSILNCGVLKWSISIRPCRQDF